MSLAWMGEGYLNSERFDDAERVLDRALTIGNNIKSEESIAYALWDIMWLHLITPDGRSQQKFDEIGQTILAAAERLEDPYLETLTCYLFSVDAMQRGYLSDAQTWADRAIGLGRRTGYPPALSLGWVSSSYVAAAAGDGPRALEDAKKAYDASAGSTERICALGGRGLAELVAGQPPQSFATFEEFHNQVEVAGFRALLIGSEVPQAAARAFAGDSSAAIADLGKSIARFTKWRNSRAVAWAHLVLGQILLGSSTSDKSAAAGHLDKAATIARGAGAMGFLLQALIAMAEAGFGDTQAHLAEARAVADEIGASSVVAQLETLASQATSRS